MKQEITKEKLEKYFNITEQALTEAKKAPIVDKEAHATIIDMAIRYVKDAHYYKEKEDWVTAFAALNYAHGWLDCGATLQLFKVTNNKLFTVDEAAP
ncbi:hypothetical protein CMO92_00430 [Candidatus Woesearchaeota archaeon]|nr:hypothetical protein [Candidatus Woesearchaeota archaeon]